MNDERKSDPVPGESEGRREDVRHRLVLNAPLAERALTGFVRDAVGNAGASGVVVGLSGGVDSALAAGLAARGLGPENVHALYLPYRTSSPDSATDAEASAEAFGLRLRTVEITPMIDAYFAIEGEADGVKRVAYALAAFCHGLVRKAHDREDVPPSADPDLHFDWTCFDADERER